MENPFAYFEKIYCINLSEDTEKWMNAQKEFNKIGITERVERFEAIKREAWPLGCNLSHLGVVKTALEQNLKNVLIFEDDVQFLNWNDDFLRDAVDNLKRENWKLFRIGYNICDDDLQYEEISSHLIRLTRRGTDIKSLHAYALHFSTFEYLIEKYEKLYAAEPIDQWICKHFDSYFLVPLMSVQNQFHPFVGYKPQVFMQNYLKHLAK